jgi:hypothetical protein
MQVCVSPKALRTVDHFLLCRFFDYQQVSFHKTVAALELVLKDICSKLLEHNLLDGSADAITARIESGQWHEFDDAYIVGLIRRLQTDTTDPIIKLKTEAVLDRNPPRLVASFEYIGNRTKEAKQEFTLKHRIVQQKVKEWAGRFGLDEQCWYTWVQPGMALTKVGATTTWSAAAAADNSDDIEQSIRIFSEQTGASVPVTEVSRSLMSVLADKALYTARVYVLLRPEQIDLKQEIRQQIRKDLPEIDWM